MENEAADAPVEARNLRDAARPEDLHLRKRYGYWMLSWRRGSKVHNQYLGTCNKLDRQTALEKARGIKLRIGG
jgi:hypothetical protein